MHFFYVHTFTDIGPRISRQGIAEVSETESLSANVLPGFDEIAQAGERCVEKVMMVEEITYDDQIVCHHSYTKKCHNTYITSFEAVQVFTYLHIWKYRNSRSMLILCPQKVRLFHRAGWDF